MNGQEYHGFVGKERAEAMNNLTRDEQVKETAEWEMEAKRQEVPSSRFLAFRNYAEAYWTMQDDILVRHLEKEMVRLSELLKRAKYYYDESMKTAGEEIEAVVLELGQTVEVAGVTASYTKAVARPSWKSVAMTFKPSRRLISEHTKVGKPSVRIKVVDDGGK